MWLSSFLLKPFVSRVKRRMLMRMVRFWRSTNDVLMCLGLMKIQQNPMN